MRETIFRIELDGGRDLYILKMEQELEGYWEVPLVLFVSLLCVFRRGGTDGDGIDRLPNPLLLRAILIGTILGTLTSGLQIVQARIGRIVEKDAVEKQALITDSQMDTVSDKVDVDRPVVPGDVIRDIPVDEEMADTATVSSGKESMDNSWWNTLGLNRVWGETKRE